MDSRLVLVLLFVLTTVKAQLRYKNKTCSHVGEPHYTSFDNLHVDWQGICKYNLASSCGGSRVLPKFWIFAKNEHRLTRPMASWPLYIEIHFDGDVVVLGSNPTTITVNGVSQTLPYTSLSGSYSVANSFGYAVFTAASAPLQVGFDGTNSVYVTVGSQYANNMCGLCGNYDGDPSNDWLMPNGIAAVDGTELGDSWIIPDPTADPDCPRRRKKRDVPLPLLPVDPEVAAICEQLGDAEGPLGPLVRKTDPEEIQLNKYNCLLDAGFSDGTSVRYSLRHFAVVGNIKNSECDECQVDLANVLPSIGFKCNRESCA